MTDDRSLERAARSFIEPGPTRAPEAAVGRALDLIATTPQERDWHVPRRTRPMTMITRLLAAAIALALVVVGGAILFRPGGGSTVGNGTPRPTDTSAPSVAPASPSRSQTAVASAGPVDFSALPGRILVEHLGNALDLSESSATDYNPDTRRFYFMDPKDMTARTVTEFLPGQPVTGARAPAGKSAADISSDQKRIVFQDWVPTQTRLYEADLDGTGLHKLPIECDCSLLYPDYNPPASKIVYVRIQAGQSWLEIFDLATHKATQLTKTVGPSADDVPEQPAWSPDGKTIAFTRLHWAGRNDPVVGTVRYGDQPPLSGKISLVDVASGAVRDVPLPTTSVILPGDANWTPNSGSLLFTHCPGSTTGSDAGLPSDCGAREINVDGTGYKILPGWGGPQFLPDGHHILVQNNVFFVMNSDGSGALPVNIQGMDVSELAQGYAYIGHWIGTP